MKRVQWLLPLLLLPILSGCGAKKQEITFYAMDTLISVTTYGENGKGAKKAVDEITACAELFGREEGSDIVRLNKAEGKPIPVDSRTAEMLSHSLEFYGMTDGACNIALGRVIDLWGFPQKQFRIPTASEIAEALTKTDCRNIAIEKNTVCLPNGMALDIGGVAKGYISDRLRTLFAEEGIDSAIVSLGGNVSVIGKAPNGRDWTVAILDPIDRSSYACFLSVRDTNVITSGTYQRYFEEDGIRYCHVIDPKTGSPVNNGLASVSVICRDGLMGDALSTALLVMGLEDALAFHKEHPVFEAIFITEDGEIVSTGIEYQKG